LANKGIRMAIWGDYLLERVRGKGLQRHTAPDGWVYHSPGAMSPQQVKALVPKDILIFNWFWNEEEGGEATEAQLQEMGFHQIYGNMTPFVHNYRERRASCCRRSDGIPFPAVVLQSLRPLLPHSRTS